jgi:Raf kinase inhibitor-like YbhB/YbcL family protein
MRRPSLASTLAFSASILAAACGGSDGDPDAPPGSIDAPPGSIDAPPGTPDAPPGTFVLTSPAFAEGGTIPDENSCQGVNISPALAWTGAPAAQSFAVVFTDLSPATDFVHSVIYDIPSTATGLPEDVDNSYEPADVPGAHQTIGYDGSTRGYLGPCPGSTHTYEFRVYALDVATLPGATMATTRAQAVTLILEHDVGDAALSGMFTP